MIMLFDSLTGSTFSVDQFKRILRILSDDDSAYYFIRFIEGLKVIEVPDDEN